MPLNDFLCNACGHKFEARRAVGARAPRCPKCKAATKKQFTAVPIMFGGSGWHSTDYDKVGPKVNGAPKASKKSDSDRTESAKPDSPKAKPAAPAGDED